MPPDPRRATAAVAGSAPAAGSITVPQAVPSPMASQVPSNAAGFRKQYSSDVDEATAFDLLQTALKSSADGYSHWSERDYRALAQIVTIVKLTLGDQICSQDEVPTFMGWVLQGTLGSKVRTAEADGSEQEQQQQQHHQAYSSGQLFGADHFVRYLMLLPQLSAVVANTSLDQYAAHCRRSSNVVVVSADSYVAVLRYSDAKQLITVAPELYIKLLHTVMTVMQPTSSSAAPILAPLTIPTESTATLQSTPLSPIAEPTHAHTASLSDNLAVQPASAQSPTVTLTSHASDVSEPISSRQSYASETSEIGSVEAAALSIPLPLTPARTNFQTQRTSSKSNLLQTPSAGTAPVTSPVMTPSRSTSTLRRRPSELALAPPSEKSTLSVAKGSLLSKRRSFSVNNDGTSAASGLLTPSSSSSHLAAANGGSSEPVTAAPQLPAEMLFRQRSATTQSQTAPNDAASPASPTVIRAKRPTQDRQTINLTELYTPLVTVQSTAQDVASPAGSNSYVLNTEARDVVKQAAKDKARYTYDVTTLKQRITKYEEIMAENQQKIQSMEEQAQKQTERISKDTATKRDYKEQIATLSSELVATNDKLHNTHTHLQAVQQQLQQAEQQTTRLTAREEELTRNNAELGTQVNSSNENLASLRSQLDQVEAKNQQLTSSECIQQQQDQWMKSLAKQELTNSYKVQHTNAYETIVQQLRIKLGESERKLTAVLEWKKKATEYADAWADERSKLKKKILRSVEALDSARRDIHDYALILRRLAVKQFVLQSQARKALRALYFRLVEFTTSQMIEQCESSANPSQTDSSADLSLRNNRLKHSVPWNLKRPNILLLIGCIEQELGICQQSTDAVNRQKHKWLHTANSFFQRNLELTTVYLEHDQQLHAANRKVQEMNGQATAARAHAEYLEGRVAKYKSERDTIIQQQLTDRRREQLDGTALKQQDREAFQTSVTLQRRVRDLQQQSGEIETRYEKLSIEVQQLQYTKQQLEWDIQRSEAASHLAKHNHHSMSTASLSNGTLAPTQQQMLDTYFTGLPAAVRHAAVAEEHGRHHHSAQQYRRERSRPSAAQLHDAAGSRSHTALPRLQQQQQSITRSQSAVHTIDAAKSATTPIISKRQVVNQAVQIALRHTQPMPPNQPAYTEPSPAKQPHASRPASKQRATNSASANKMQADFDPLTSNESELPSIRSWNETDARNALELAMQRAALSQQHVRKLDDQAVAKFTEEEKDVS